MMTLARPQHDHADAHLHVGEALILGEQRAAQRDEAVRQRETENRHACRR